jgi:hypothetical protein
MPETAVNENNFSPGGKNQIRLAGKQGNMKPETVA